MFATALLVNIATGGDVMGFLKHDLLSQRLPLDARLYPGLELLVESWPSTGPALAAIPAHPWAW